MTSDVRRAPLALSTALGLSMVAATGVSAGGFAVTAAALAVTAVLAGIRFRPAATLAVLCTVAVIVLSDSPPVFAGLSGLSAAAYLVLRHAVHTPAGAVTASVPIAIAALGFTFVGLVATAFPLRLPWLPLLAPLAVFGLCVLVSRPFVRWSADRDA
jgi:hypothetical protein